MKRYRFALADGRSVEASVVGGYRGSTRKDIDVMVEGLAEVLHLEEVDGGSAGEEVVNWLLAKGCEFESDRSMWFNAHYIDWVMCDHEHTEDSLLDRAASLSEDEIRSWKEWVL